MATDISLGPDQKSMLAHPALVRKNVSNSEVSDMIKWSKGPDIPGHFKHWYNQRDDIMVFSFSDENSAFQFKMRWA